MANATETLPSCSVFEADLINSASHDDADTFINQLQMHASLHTDDASKSAQIGPYGLAQTPNSFSDSHFPVTDELLCDADSLANVFSTTSFSHDEQAPATIGSAQIGPNGLAPLAPSAISATTFPDFDVTRPCHVLLPRLLASLQMSPLPLSDKELIRFPALNGTRRKTTKVRATEYLPVLLLACRVILRMLLLRLQLILVVLRSGLMA